MLAVSPSTRHAVIDSPIGPLTIVRDDEGITGLYYPGHWTRPDPAGFGPRAEAADDRGRGGIDQAAAQLGEYFAGARREFDLPLTPHGSPAAQRVWKLLAEIPYGQTTTYGTLAREIGGTINARAVGGFVGRNPLSIFIPCHRVVGSTGQLTGYAGGLDRKQHLLELEGTVTGTKPGAATSRTGPAGRLPGESRDDQSEVPEMSTVSPSTRHTVMDSPIGPLTVVRDEDGITGVYFRHHWTRPDPATFGPRVEAAGDRGFDAVISQLGEYLAGERREFDLPLTPHGDPAAQRVWKLLAEIPYGQTTTYGALARQVGGDVTAQEIGGFVGANPLSILIPCHRVVGAAGQLTGYAGGLKRKQHLLELEEAVPASPAGLW